MFSFTAVSDLVLKIYKTKYLSEISLYLTQFTEYA